MHDDRKAYGRVLDLFKLARVIEHKQGTEHARSELLGWLDEMKGDPLHRGEPKVAIRLLADCSSIHEACAHYRDRAKNAGVVTTHPS